MGTAQQVVDLARQHIGYIEGPRNNETKFGAWSGYNFQPWCGSFINWLFHSTNTHGEPSVVWTPGGANSYRAKGRLLPRNSNDVRPGDVVFFDWGGSQNTANIDHVGLVEAVFPDGRIQTIEGNTSASDRGSQSNGGGVWRRVRPRGVIAGFGRPNYSADPNSPYNPNSNVDWVKLRKFLAASLQNDLRPVGTLRMGSSGSGVVALQKALNLVSGVSLTADGSFGNATRSAVVAFQKFFKLGADGVVGPATKNMLIFALEAIKNGK
jgi:hypothetical protein